MLPIGVCFHFEDKDTDFWSGHRIDLDLWRIPAKACGIITFAMIDLSSARPQWTDSECTLTTYNSLAEFEIATASDRHAYMVSHNELPNAPDVSMFPHDIAQMTWYVFGPSAGFSPQTGDGRDYYWIPQVNQAIGLFSHQAACFMAGLLTPRLITAIQQAQSGGE